ncbi:MAG: hypothetical protein LBT29_07010 [Flavobacteriaceae bacterium]|jgi:uncharacterized membrane protein|nr:hypothetical protein [Flavobacteriaceae bacterium]
MKTNNFLQLISLVAGIYLVVRSLFFYRQSDDEHKFFALVYASLGIVILLTFLYLYFKNRNSRKND